MSSSKNSPLFWLGLGAAAGAALYTAKIVKSILAVDQAQRIPAWAQGRTFSEYRQAPEYTVAHTVEAGIERIHYIPTARHFETPILMQHGMWHGAWCWQPWQELLAQRGWESIAISLPGHGLSPTQRPLMLCTLEYYLGFLHAEAARLPRKPILMGHSLGGALVQWYLKYIGDDLPAAVLVAPWVADDILAEVLPNALRLDPVGTLQTLFHLTAAPFIRSPEHSTRMLLSPQNNIDPSIFHARLNAESALILLEHRPPRWTPPTNLQTPMLLLAGELDAIIRLSSLERTAAHYGADFHPVPQAGHNLMHAASFARTADAIHTWLAARLK